jgi:hypothetical protein
MSYHLQILSELRKLIVEDADNAAKIIQDGLAIKDFHTYKEHVGRLYAYRRVLDLFEVAAEKVEKST